MDKWVCCRSIGQSQPDTQRQQHCISLEAHLDGSFGLLSGEVPFAIKLVKVGHHFGHVHLDTYTVDRSATAATADTPSIFQCWQKQNARSSRHTRAFCAPFRESFQEAFPVRYHTLNDPKHLSLPMLSFSLSRTSTTADLAPLMRKWNTSGQAK